MGLTELLLITIIILLLVLLYLVSKSARAQFGLSVEDKGVLESIKGDVPKIENTLRNEISLNRTENTTALKETREELGKSINAFGDLMIKSAATTTEAQKNQLEAFASNLSTLTKSFDEKLTALITTVDQKLKEGSESAITQSTEARREQKENLQEIKKNITETLGGFNERQRENFDNLVKTQGTQNTAITEKIASMTTALQSGLKSLQEGNEQKLEQMRKTVDEKLHDTLEKRFGESFKFVSDRLDAVHKGLGDMQSLASNVGDLKKVMTNVKSRGVLGEYQLLNILDDLLTQDQYEKNVKTKDGSGAVVEFAIKMPNGKDAKSSLWLPVDSKFPKEDYEALVNAYEEGNIESQDALRKAFKNGIIKNAKDIREKYIDPPNTTEYGIMFLPFESLYAEVLRTPGLFELIQKEYKVTITGPTTLSALINSLQMGFRTLAIERRSSEVWDLLGAVKTEFTAFGDILDKTQKKLQEASNVIDKAGVRTRAIEKKLRKVQELPADQTSKMIDEIELDFGAAEPEELYQ